MFLAEFSEGMLLGWFLEVCVVLGTVFGKVSKSNLLLRVGWFRHDPNRGNSGIGGCLGFWLVGCVLFNTVPYWIQVIFVLVES